MAAEFLEVPTETAGLEEQAQEEFWVGPKRPDLPSSKGKMVIHALEVGVLVGGEDTSQEVAQTAVEAGVEALAT